MVVVVIASSGKQVASSGIGTGTGNETSNG